jgi:protein gp37
MSDLFHEDVPNEWREQVWDVMRRCPQHRFFMLTKRYRRMRYWAVSRDASVLPNVAIGVSIETQAWAEKRIPALLETPAAMRFVSVEPCLSPVSLALMRLGRLDALAGDAKTRTGEIYAGGHGLDWVIAGCESGPGRRTTCLDWFRTLRDECIHSNVPFFLKQMDVGGKLRHMPRLDGRVWDQRPEGW